MTLVSLQSGGIAVVHVPDRLLVEAVEHLRRWASRPAHRKVQHSWHKFPPDIEILVILTGNSKVAESILQRFGNVANAIANLSEWRSVKGVGVSRLDRARRILLGESYEQ